MKSVSGNNEPSEPCIAQDHPGFSPATPHRAFLLRALLCAAALTLASGPALPQSPSAGSQPGDSASEEAFQTVQPPISQSTSGTQTVSLSYLEGLRPSSISSVSTLGPDLFGDKVNLFNGSLQFEHTDLEVPGNSSIPVALTRRYSPGRLPYVRGVFGDWDLHIPRITGSFSEQGWVTGSGGVNRCTGYSAPAAVVVGGGSGPVGFQYNQFWHGTTLDVPGQSADELLSRAPAYPAQPSDGHAYPLVTKGHWQIRCLPGLQNAAGEGFVAISPQGVQYRFDWMASRYAGGVNKAGAALARYDVSLYATRVTDRFGGYVEYTFNPAQPGQLQRITGSDGRIITLTYSGDLVTSASDGSRTYSYGYTAGQLTTVTRPDGSRWVFNLGGMLYPQHEWLGEGAKCDSPGMFPSSASMIGVITHPSGAVGTFTTQFRTHGRTYVDRHCWFVQGTSGQTTGNVYPHYTRSQTLTQKTITGPGLAPLTWTYNYGVVSGWNPCVGCPDRKTNTVTAPDGSMSRHVFGVRWRVNEGQLLQTDEGVRDAVTLRSTFIRYRVPGSESCPERFGTSPNAFGDILSTLNRPEDWRQIQQKEVGHPVAALTWQLADGGGGLDSMCRPLRVTESSSLGHSRTTWTSHHDSTAPWVVGQLRQSVDHDGAVQTQIDYDPATALPWRRWQYDRLVQTYAYHGDGNLWKVFDPLHRPTIWNDYHRGVARQFFHRDGAQESAIINNLGKPVSYTNAAGTTTVFGYDAMGRLNLIRRPAEAHGPYHDITDQFEQSGAEAYGLAGGHWRQTTRNGNAVTVRYYDALWRARLVNTYDATQEGATASRTVIRYNHDGRKIYESYPTREAYLASDSPPGRWTTYDDLGRETLQQQSSELGLLNTTTTEYLADLSKRVTNARGHSTTFHHQVFAKPDNLAILRIELPLAVWVRIDRDTEGRATAITRGGGAQTLTRRYAYDAHKRLCKTVEPESGATILAYDAAGNIGWRASGLALPSTNCDWSFVPDHKKLFMQYDERDRLKRTAHGDGSASVIQLWTPDSQLAETTAFRVGTNTIRWTYNYNNLRLLVQEKYEWGDPNNAWHFKRLIDTHGNESAIEDPWGSRIDFAPNALGQPSRAGTYATGATYHPNGMLAGYTSGNGRAHALYLNARGLPLEWISSGAVHDRFTYDGVGNITGIADHHQGQHRSMQYDGLDRLTQANGPWGSAGYTYDAIDNLVASTVGGRTLSHGIDPASNRLTSLSGSMSLSILYDEQGNVRNSGGQEFVFDLANRLVNAPGRAYYAYDGHGRRNLTWFADGTYRHDGYTKDGKLRMTWRLGQGSKRFVFLGDRLVAEDSSAGISYVHTDHLGSPVVRSDESGAVQESTRTRYEPYGATVAGSMNPTGIGFTGHVNDPEIGMVYMQQRYYDPIAGRFLSVDPVSVNTKTGGMFNRYEYAYSNPYRFFDPDGRCNASRIDTAPGSICGGSGGRLGAAAEAIAARKQHVARELSSAANSVGNAISAAAPQAISLLRYTSLGLLAGILMSEGADAPEGKEPPVPGATPGRETKGRTTQWEKPGGIDQANDDFDAKGPGDIVPLPGGGRRGTLPDGRKIIVRPDSTDGRPTLEIQDGKSRDKVRYGT
jgi:RHS repeat-associated protein